MNAAVVNILISGLFFAGMNVLVRYCHDYSTYQVILIRALVTLFISYLFIRKKGLNPFGNERKLLFLRGLFGFISLSLYFLTLQKIPLASAVSFQYLSPVFTALLAIFINRQRFPLFTWIFYAIAIGGVFLIQGVDSRIHWTMLLAGMGSALAAGAAYNVIRKIGKRDDPDVIVFYFPLVTLPFVLWPALQNWIWPNSIDWLILIGVGICTQFGQIFMTRAYQHSQLAGVAIFQYFGMIYALTLGWFLFDEQYAWLTYLGMFLLVAGAIGNALMGNRAKTKT